MNTIHSVGSLMKALSAYPVDAKITVRVDGKPVVLNSDYQIRNEIHINGKVREDRGVIISLQTGKDEKYDLNEWPNTDCSFDGENEDNRLPGEV